MLATTMAERRLIPDWLVRVGIRRLLQRRLVQEMRKLGRDPDAATQQFCTELRASPIAIETDAANEQHYEVPAEFFRHTLGHRLKYSCGYWPETVNSLDDAEDAMLRLTCERAGIRNGMRILELGCGWGSLCLWIAEHFPDCRILALSNSAGQRRFIRQTARSRGFENLEVITRNITAFATDQRFDRVVSVEMFEHLRNYQRLFGNIADWLEPAGKLFFHVFCHQQLAYAFDTDGDTDWMARHFFTGGIMPSQRLFEHFQEDLRITDQWSVNGGHYARTCEAWLCKLDRRRGEIHDLFGAELSSRDADLQIQRWRMFFMACAELFRYDDGQQWFVSHYLLEPAA